MWDQIEEHLCEQIKRCWLRSWCYLHGGGNVMVWGDSVLIKWKICTRLKWSCIIMIIIIIQYNVSVDSTWFEANFNFKNLFKVFWKYDQVCWAKNIDTVVLINFQISYVPFQINAGILTRECCVNQISCLAWPVNKHYDGKVLTNESWVFCQRWWVILAMGGLDLMDWWERDCARMTQINTGVCSLHFLKTIC